jgi:hypothetical protein
METRGLRRTFADLGVSGAPESGDGLELVRAAHVPGLSFLEGATALDYAVPWAMDSDEFRGGFLRRHSGPELPFLDAEPIELDSTVGSWNSEEAASRLKAVILDASDSSEARGFWVPLVSRVLEEGMTSGHMCAVEFALRPRNQRPIRAWLYNPSHCRASRTTRVTHTDLLRWGLLLPTMSDPDVRAALGWPPLGPLAWISEFRGRSDAQFCTRCLRASIRYTREALESDDWFLRTREAMARQLEWMGLNSFAPAAPCQVGPGDFLCQTWVFWLYRFRARHDRPEDAANALDAVPLAERRRDLLALVRAELRGPAASEFWSKQRFERLGGGFTEGRSFAAWLAWAAERPDFGARYLAGASDARAP